VGVTIQQIADRVGVSPSTVSAALSPVCTKRISQKRIDEIVSVARKMGYRPNLSARCLRTGKTFKIGVVIGSYLSHFPLSNYFDLLTNEFEKHQYRTLPLQLYRQSEISPEIREVEEGHVDGLVILDLNRKLYDHYLELWQNSLPMVFRVLDPAFRKTPFDHVLVDHPGAMTRLIKHLVERQWEHLVFLAESVETQPDVIPRVGYFRGWRQTVEEYARQGGVTHSVITYKNRTARERYEATRAFLKEAAFKPGRTALVADGGDGVSGVYAACAEAGIRIGSDIAVAAITRTPANEYLFPGLTMLVEPYEEIAREMTRLLMKSIESGAESAEEPPRMFALDLVPGDSTRREGGSSI
jgi:DNA-binding LacI/PurR family transcriptional regulator